MTEKQDSRQALASAPLWPLMLRLALPAVVAQLVNLLYNIVDRIYIGHMPETGVYHMPPFFSFCFPNGYL